MAKEEELKRVDLKVNVSCCDGCRRKVMKAMSLKGVLRTEIHPSLDRVTVVGNVDTKVLMKKLAKVGKIAEVAVAAAADKQLKKREGEGDGDGRKDRDDGGDKPAGAEKSKRKDGGKDMGDKPVSASSKNKDCHKCAHQQSARGDDAAADHGHSKAPSTKDGAGSAFKEEDDGFAAGERSATVNAPAAHHHYNRAEPPSMAVPVHMPYYEPSNMTAPSYYAPPNVMTPLSYYAPANVAAPPYYGGGYYVMPPPMPTMPMPWRPAQQQQQRQVSRFDVDYFNEDNTAGCRVM